jgi:colicin import membrane protein
MRLRTLMSAAFLLSAGMAQGKPTDLNVVTKVEVQDAGSSLVISIQGSKPPNFTTFSMLDPPRFVVDFSESRFRDVPEDLPVSGGLIKTIRNLNYGADANSIARVMIAFDRDVEPPEVQASGTSLQVKVLKPSGMVVASAAPADESAQRKAREDAVAKAEAETRAKTEAKAKADADAQAKADAKARAQAEARTKADAEAQAKADSKARAKAESQAKAEAAAQAKAEAKAKAEEEARAKAEAKAQARAEAKAKAEEEAKTGTEAKAQVRAEAKAKAEAVAQAKAEQKAKAEEEARTKAEAKAQAKAEAKTKAEEEAKARAEAKAQARAEAKARAEAAAQAKAEQKATGTAGPGESETAAVDLESDAEGEADAADQAMSAGTSRVREVGFRLMAEVSRVFVRTSGLPRFSIQDAGEKLVRVELSNTQVKRRNDTRFLDTSYFPSAVAMVTPKRQGSSYVLEIKLKQRVAYQQKVEGDTLAIDFERPVSMRSAAPAASGPVQGGTEAAGPVDSAAPAGEGEDLEGEAPSSPGTPGK